MGGSGRMPANGRGRAALLALVLLGACEANETPPAAAPLEVAFRSRRPGSGIDFETRPGGSGEKHFLEINLGGVSMLDYDGDGLLDLYFCQGQPLRGHPDFGTVDPDRLYRNLGDFRFEDVTERTGAGEAGYTFSATATDYDGDGDVDLYLCNWGPNRLLQNDGGVFHDVTERTGLAGDEWSSAACFVDFDRDGDLDVYVTNYVRFDLDEEHWCGDKEKGPNYRAYCHPDEFEAQDDRLYRNDGVVEGVARFVDVTQEAGIAGSGGKGLGLVPFDADDDGDVDLFVANDAVPNFLWQNEGGLRFRDQGVALGVAQNGTGKSESCMGSDAADVDGDGDLDLFTANMAQETNTLWTNEGRFFVDDTPLSGLAQDSRLWVGFGARFLDYDLDGDPDLILANGHVMDNVELYDPHETFAQPDQLYENVGRGKFRLVKEAAGPYFVEQHVGRGLALGDLDNDGDADVAIANNRSAPVLLENRRIHPGRTDAHWLGLVLHGKAPNTQALGARVRVEAGDRVFLQEVRTVCSYAAAGDARLLFGLGDLTGVDRVSIRWPRGTVQELTGLRLGQYHVLEEPDGASAVNAER